MVVAVIRVAFMIRKQYVSDCLMVFMVSVLVVVCEDQTCNGVPKIGLRKSSVSLTAQIDRVTYGKSSTAKRGSLFLR